MTLTMDKCIRSARAAADAVWMSLGPWSAFSWTDTIAGPTPSVARASSPTALAQYIWANRKATAADLYAFAVADDKAAAPWARLPVPLRVSIEIFRATFLVLAELYEAEQSEIRRRMQSLDAARHPKAPAPAAEGHLKAPAPDAEGHLKAQEITMGLEPKGRKGHRA